MKKTTFHTYDDNNSDSKVKTVKTNEVVLIYLPQLSIVLLESSLLLVGVLFDNYYYYPLLTTCTQVRLKNLSYQSLITVDTIW